MPQLVVIPWLQLCTSMGPFQKSAKYEGRMIQELQQQIIELTLALREKGEDFESEQRRHRALQGELGDLATEFELLQERLKENQAKLEDERLRAAEREQEFARATLRAASRPGRAGPQRRAGGVAALDEPRAARQDGAAHRQDARRPGVPRCAAALPQPHRR